MLCSSPFSLPFLARPQSLKSSTCSLLCRAFWVHASKILSQVFLARSSSEHVAVTKCRWFEPLSPVFCRPWFQVGPFEFSWGSNMGTSSYSLFLSRTRSPIESYSSSCSLPHPALFECFVRGSNPLLLRQAQQRALSSSKRTSFCSGKSQLKRWKLVQVLQQDLQRLQACQKKTELYDYGHVYCLKFRKLWRFETVCRISEYRNSFLWNFMSPGWSLFPHLQHDCQTGS